MLSAILNGKGRRLPDGLPPGASLRMAFKRSEDILTATVFERLAYLDGHFLWQILEATFRPKILPTRKLVTLDDVEFWPTWGQARDTIGKAVEPDVVLRLTVGDPPVKVVLIVECKLDGLQYPRQWAHEWIAYQAQAQDDEQADEIYLLALGGVTRRTAAMVAEFTTVIGRDHAIEIKAAGASWQQLRDVLESLSVESAAGRRVIGDVKAALDLHGFRSFRPMGDLVRVSWSLGPVAQEWSSLQFEEVAESQPVEPRDGFSDFAAKTRDLRPIQDRGALRWGDENA